jgi:hypothetical protein
MSVPRLGDIYEFRAPSAFFYGQYVYEDTSESHFGSVLRFPREAWEASIAEPASLFTADRAYFLAWAPIAAFLKKEASLARRVGHRALEPNFRLPLFRIGYGNQTFPDREAGAQMSDVELDQLPSVTAYMELSLLKAVANAAGRDWSLDALENWLTDLRRDQVPPATATQPSLLSGSRTGITIRFEHSIGVEDKALRDVVERVITSATMVGANFDGEEVDKNGWTYYLYTDDVQGTLGAIERVARAFDVRRSLEVRIDGQLVTEKQ